MAQVTSPSASVVASPSKVELNQDQAHAILDNLSLLAFDTHKKDRLTYSSTSVTLGTSSGLIRTTTGMWNYYTGSDVTPDLVSLLPLIRKVHTFITKNQTILNEYLKRNLWMGKVDKAILGLEALKTNQYDKLDDKKKLIDKSIEVLKTTKTALEEKQSQTTEVFREESRQRIKEEEARQKAKDDLIVRLKEENRVLRIQAAAAGNTKDLSPEKLISLAQDCLKLASSKMNEAASLRKTTT